MISRPIRAIRKARTRGLPGILALVRLLPVAAALFVGWPAHAGNKHSLNWKHSTKVETPAEAPGPSTGNPNCDQISANINRRVATIKALKVSIDQAASGPPSSVQSALEGMFGTAQPTTKTIELERKIKQERRSADDLNAMMVSLKCDPVDIDQALAKQTAEDHGKPVVPRSAPDDLVRNPIRH